MAGARVEHWEGAVASGPDGRFAMVLRTAAAALRISAAGFEPREWTLLGGNEPIDLRIPLAARATYSSAVGLTASLTADDFGHYVGEPYESPYCRPCRVIRLDSDVERSAAIHLRWVGDGTLGLWASDGATAVPAEALGPRHLTVPAIGSGDNRRVYVGVPLQSSAAMPVVFTLSRN